MWDLDWDQLAGSNDIPLVSVQVPYKPINFILFPLRHSLRHHYVMRDVITHFSASQKVFQFFQKSSFHQLQQLLNGTFLFSLSFFVLFFNSLFSLEVKNIFLIIQVGQPVYTFHSYVCFPAQKWRHEWAQRVARAPLLGWKVSAQHYLHRPVSIFKYSDNSPRQ